MKAKRWTARHVAQRTATLTRKAQHYTARLAEIGEPQDRHQSRTVSMARRSLKRAQDELATLAAYGVTEACHQTESRQAMPNSGNAND